MSQRPGVFPFGILSIVVAAVFAVALVSACSGGGGGSVATTPTAAASSAANQFAAVYRAASWGSNVAVTFPTSCTMTYTTTGVPSIHNAYYLAPVSTQYPTAVAVTPVSHTEMSLVPYTPASITGSSITLSTCPAKAASTTATNMGAIGYMISGLALFNPYEGNGAGTPALSDNVTYTFTDSSGTPQTASFIDACNSHPTPLTVGYSWHYHGVPSCVTSQVDTSTGPSHLIGVALDGFPVYGGRDINGNVISMSQLDACNGITSATPEFPNGVYHYVLPIGVTGSQSSPNCYAGTVTQTQVAIASRFMCGIRPKAAAVARSRRRRRDLLAALFPKQKALDLPGWRFR